MFYNKRPDKEICEKEHAIKRARQRYFPKFTEQDLMRVRKKVIACDGVLLFKQSMRISCWEINYLTSCSVYLLHRV